MIKCPKCGSKRVIKIIYGCVRLRWWNIHTIFLPRKYIVAGRYIEGESPTLYCKKCKNRWGNRISSVCQ